MYLQMKKMSMNRNKFFVIMLFVVLLIFFSNDASADLSCDMISGCFDTVLLYVGNDSGGYNNAHAQLASEPPAYPYTICCDSTTETLGYSCAASKYDIFLELYDFTNSHVQDSKNASITPDYTNNACLSSTATVYCTTAETSCPAGYECLASMASSEGYNYTNAHLGACDYYSLQVCCFANSKPSVSSVVLASTSGNNLTSDNLTVSFTQSDVDGHTVYNTTDWRLNGTSIAVLNMPFNTNVSNYSGYYLKDYSTNENNGSLGGRSSTYAPTWSSSGKIGGAYYFNDNNKFINFSWVNLSCERTVSLWAYAENSADYGVLISTRGGAAPTDSQGWVIRLNQNLQQISIFHSGGTSVITNQDFSAYMNKWTHIVWKFDTTNGHKIFFDGVNVFNNSATTCANEVNNSLISLKLGVTGEPSTLLSHDFKGYIDQVLLFNKSLSDEQIKKIYSEELTNHSVNPIVSQETENGDNWTVAVTPSDGYDDGTTVVSNEVLIGNSPPTIPSLISPVDDNITQRFPDFDWSDSTDPDGESVTYEINVTAPSGLGCADYSDTGIAASTTTSTLELCTDLDYASGSFAWSVRACDSTECSDWSSIAYFNITSVNNITLISDTVDFTNLTRNQSYSTEGNTSFVIENSGNIRLNISSRALDALFDSYPSLNDSSFQFKVAANESSAYDSGESTTSYVNVTNASQIMISRLLWSDSADDARIDFNVTVPLFEGAGTKQSTVEVSSAPDYPT